MPQRRGLRQTSATLYAASRRCPRQRMGEDRGWKLGMGVPFRDIPSAGKRRAASGPVDEGYGTRDRQDFRGVSPQSGGGRGGKPL